MVTNEVEQLAARPYRVVMSPLSQEDGGGWFAEIPDLPGCGSDGESQAEALANVEDAKREWLATALELGRPIPEPTMAKETYSGKMLVRAPKRLHRTLAEQANEQGVSLNQYVVYLLSKGIRDDRATTTEKRVV